MADAKAAAWDAFLKQLSELGLDFPSIQFADGTTRAELLASMSLSIRDRALVSSQWAQQAAASVVTDPPRHSSASPAPTAAASPGTSPITRRVASFDASTLSVAVDFDVRSLKAALDRGDSGTALPLASEMLQADPAGLIHLLHEYLPHVSVEQLKSMLGIGAVMSATGPSASLLRGQEGEVDSRASTMNGRVVQPGLVLTSQALASQYGIGFTASCNGAFLAFPYCVQKGDHIIVRPADDRL